MSSNDISEVINSEPNVTQFVKPSVLIPSVFPKDSVKSDSAEIRRKRTAASIQAAKDLAWSPLRTLLMNSVILYMSGTQLNIISVIISILFITQPLYAIFSVGSVFAHVKQQGVHKTQLQAIFITLQLLSMFIALFKAYWMGLLPTRPSDWLSLLPPPSAAAVVGRMTVFPPLG
eukprot:TRINITY_DN5623_c0_g1_i9.p1 TRINITY_DN5623_c0_g1~~TRINITY_DN5623_c0_g1_i9.p1  ORF type:complete len:174 (+),score=38.05 TRINITY_DN5623_c0_g1_i9:50-571(+)